MPSSVLAAYPTIISWFSLLLNSNGRNGSSRNEYSDVLRLSSESIFLNYLSSLESTLLESTPVLFLEDILLSIPFTEFIEGLMPVSLELDRVFLAILFVTPILPDDESLLKAAVYIVLRFLKLSELPDIFVTLFNFYKLVSLGVFGLFLDCNNLLYESSSLSNALSLFLLVDD